MPSARCGSSFDRTHPLRDGEREHRRERVDRRRFLSACGVGASGVLLPGFTGRAIAAEQLVEPLDPALKRRLADAALSAAKTGGASYCDVRVGRYLRQFVMTRETRVENVVNTESTGVGVRVIAGDRKSVV